MLKHLIYVHRYPRYFVDIVLVKLYSLKWQQQNIEICKPANIMGLPIISTVSDSIISIGSNCLLCSRSSQTALGVSHPIIVRTLKSGAKIFIGNHVRMSGTTICCSSEIRIGDRCVIGSDVIIADTDFHALSPEIRSTEADFINAKSMPIKIGHDVFIGAKSIILKGTTLGNNVIVGAGSLVTKSYGDNSIIAGNPAKLIGFTK